MANNEYVNKVLFGNNTIMDISDTTAEQGDVIEGQVFYTKSGAPATGILGDATISTHGLMSVEDKVKLDNIDEIQIDKTIDTPAAIMSFSDGADNLPMALTVGIEPVQDLHGYENPWPGGGSRNILKAKDMSQTTGNVTGSTNKDSGGNVVDYTVSSSGGGFSSFYPYEFPVKSEQVTYKINITKKPTNGIIGAWNNTSETDVSISNNTITIPANSNVGMGVYFSSGQTATSEKLQIIAVANSETETSFIPYSNICPISGWTDANVTRTGKNCLEITMQSKTVSGITFTVNSDGSFSANGTASADITEQLGNIHADTGDSVIINGCPANGSSTKYFLTLYGMTTQSSDFGKGSASYVLPSIKAAYVIIKNGQTISNLTFKPMIRLSTETDATFAPYAKNVYSITFPDSEGTVYGGELTINKDGSGSLVVDTGIVDFGDLTWNYISNKYFQSTDIIPYVKTGGGLSNNNPANAISSIFKIVAWNDSSATSGCLAIKLEGEASGMISCINSNYTDAATFKTAMAGQKLVYELATPITYSLTPGQVKTLLGMNNIWADTGDINSVTYSKPTSGLINTYDKVKLNSLATVSLTGNYNDLLNKPDLSAYLTTVPTMVGATSDAAGTAGLVPAPAADAYFYLKFLCSNGTWSTVNANAWSGMTASPSDSLTSLTSAQVLARQSSVYTTIKFLSANATPTAYNLAMYDANAYLNSTTASSTDNSTKVATTAFVKSVLPSTMIGATNSVAGASGLVPAPTTGDVDKFLAGDGTYKSGGLPMVILSYGNSTWAEFEAAYNNNVIVYTRASSNSNPATGSQTRMAFMAYVNNATTPTEVEFQYYRSMSSHSATAMGDQVFVYKLTKTGGWSVTSRDASIKQIKVDTDDPGTISWSSNVVTLKSGLPKVTASDDGKILKVVNGVWTAVSPE